jgi:hypothetical protein
MLKCGGEGRPEVLDEDQARDSDEHDVAVIGSLRLASLPRGRF